MTGSGRLWAVVPAAGQGERMRHATPKQYLKLGERTILDHTLSRLVETHLFHGIVVAIRPDDEQWRASELAGHSLISTVCGGAERADSVLAALDALIGMADPEDWVLVHDAARPCITRADILHLIDIVDEHPVGGILARPINDTVKMVDQTSIKGTLDRNHLWRALTPQMFRLGELRQALQQGGAHITDESSAMEAIGRQPIVVCGRADNIKITEPEDLVLAALYLQQQEQH